MSTARFRSLLLIPTVATFAAISLVEARTGSPSPPPPEGAAASAEPQATQETADEAHLRILLNNTFPSATTCAACHPRHFRDWSMSQHAYSQMSPIFNAMSGKLIQLTNGTNGDFCIRCHSPIGMNLGEREFMSNIDRHPTAREGVTCVACHRVDKAYGQISGRLAMVEGDLTTAIYGPTGENSELSRVIEEAGVITAASRTGRLIHREVESLFQLTTPD